MKAISLFVACIVLGLSAGCATLQPKAAKILPPPAAVPAPPVAPVSGTDLDPHNTENVRLSESLKAYPIGRTIDPNDPNLMHEAHVVYRKETDGTWNLNPNAPTVVALGPTLAVADPAQTPNPLPAELERKIAEQNQLMSSLIEQNEALATELAKLNKEMSDLRKNQPVGSAPEGGKTP
jgi:hypothetical protein